MAAEIVGFSEGTFKESFLTLMGYVNATEPRLLWLEGASLPPTSRPRLERASGLRINEITGATTVEGDDIPLSAYPPTQRIEADLTIKEWSIMAPGDRKTYSVRRTIGGANNPYGKPDQSLHTLNPPVTCELFSQLAATSSELVIVANGLSTWCREHPKQEVSSGYRSTVQDVLAHLVAKSTLIYDYESPPKDFMNTLADFGSWQDNVRLSVGDTLGVVPTKKQIVRLHQRRMLDPSRLTKAAVVFTEADLLPSDFWFEQGIIHAATVASEDFLRAFHAIVRNPDNSLQFATEGKQTAAIHTYIENLLLYYQADLNRSKPPVIRLHQTLQSPPKRRRETLSKLIKKAKEHYATSPQPRAYEQHRVEEYLAPALFDLLAFTRSRDRAIRDKQRQLDRLHCEVIAAVMKKR